MRVDFKETIYRQFTFLATEAEELLISEAVKSGKITDSDSFYAFLANETDIDPDFDVNNEFNIDTAQTLTREENGGKPTIEVFADADDDGYPPIATN